MSTISINTPDGKTIDLNAPEGATQDQIRQAAQAAVAHYKQTTTAPSNFDKAKALYSSYQNNPLVKFGPNLPQTMGEIGQNLANVAGKKTATTLEAVGVNRNIASGVGTAIKMAPMAAGFLGVGAAAQEAAQSGELGITGRVISGPARAEAGQAIGAAEKAVGVNPNVIPTLKDVTANLGLKSANEKQYLNALLERLNSGEEMGPEALSQHHKMITEILSKEPQRAQQLFRATRLGSPAVAQAAKIDKILVERLNQAAPGRADAAANYAASILRNKIYKGAAATTAGAVLGKNAILNALSRLTGQ